MNERLRYYLNTGLICYLVGLILSGIGPELTFLLLPTFNILIFRRLNHQLERTWRYGTLLTSIGLTTFLFFLQLNYLQELGWSCFGTGLSDFQTANGYLTTMFIFSIITWELGTGFANKQRTNSAIKTGG